MRGVTASVLLVATAAQEPACSTAAQTHQLIHQLQLHVSGNLVVQGFNLTEPVREVEDVTHDHISACHVRRAHAGRLFESLNEGDAHVVDQVVGDLGADDLTLEAVATHGLGELGDQARWERGFHVTGQVVVIRHQRLEQRFLEVDLAVGDQHRQLRTGQALAVRGALVELLLGRQVLDGAVQLATAFQVAHQTLVLGGTLVGTARGQGQGLGLLVVVAQHQVADFVGHARQQLVALLVGHVTGLHHFVEQDLDVHFVVGAVHATGVVDEVGVGTAAIEAEFHATQLGHTEVTALAHYLAAQLVAVDAQRVVGLVAHIGMALGAGLDVRTNAAVPQQVHRRLEQGIQQLGRGQLVGRDVEALFHLWRDGNALRAARKDTAAFRHDAGVVVGPGRTRQLEHALTLDEAGRRVRVWIDEDMQVVERCDQLQLVGHQQAVTEHVTGHIADADHGDAVFLHVDAALTEVTLHTDPRALGGDAHFLVVVTGGTAGRERVAQPEAVVDGDAVGDVGEGRSALVRRYHQIRVIVVMTHDVGRRHQGAVLQVVGDVQQAGNEDAVAGDALGRDLVTAAAQWQATRQEAALRTHRHDDRVLHLLGFYQAEHFSAEVFFTVGPAQAAARDVAEAQVHTFDAWRVHEDFKLRHGLRQLRDRMRVELEAEVRLVLAVGVGLVEVGAQGRLDQVQVATQDAVFVEHLNVVQGRKNRLFQALLLVFQVVAGELARQVETGLEQPGQLAGDVGVVVQGAGDVTQVEAQADLLQVTGVGTQQCHVAPRQAGSQYQAVERIVFSVAVHDVHKRILQGVVELLDVQVHAFGGDEREVMDPELTAIGMTQTVRELTQHTQAEVFQDRQHVGQRQRGVGVVELAMQLALARHLAQRLVETHHQRVGFGQAEQVLHVDHGRMRGETLAVTGWEAFREVGQHVGAVGFAEAFHDQAGVVVLPAAAGLHHFFFQLQRVDVQAVLRVNPQDQLYTGQHGLGEERPEFAIRGLQAIHQHLLDLLAHFGGIDVAWHVGQAVAETTVRVFTQEHADLVAFLDLYDRHHGTEQLVDRGLEQVITGQHFNHLRQFLAQVSLGLEAGTAFDFRNLATDIRNHPHAFAIHRRGVQAHETMFLDHFAVGADLTDRHIVRIRRTVHAARVRGLGERQHSRFTQVGYGIVFDAQVIGGEAGAQQFGQAEERIGVIFDMTAVRLVTYHEFFIAEEGEVVAHQPFQEVLDLGFLFAVDAELAGVDTGQQVLDLGFHRFEIGHGHAHFAQHLLQLFAQHVQFGGVGATVDFQVHQRFLQDAFALGAFWQDLQQLALGATAYAEYGGLQGVNAVATAVQLGTHRVHQERQVMVQHFDRGMGRLPAMTFVIGVVDPHLRLGVVKALKQAPRRKSATGQVGKATLGQFVQGNDAEELFSEQRHLWQCLFTDVLRQCRLQLMLEVGLAGCGEERHLWYSAWACY